MRNKSKTLLTTDVIIASKNLLNQNLPASELKYLHYPYRLLVLQILINSQVTFNLKNKNNFFRVHSHESILPYWLCLFLREKMFKWSLCLLL